MQGTKRVLLISSLNPMRGPGIIGQYIYEAFREQKYEVDFLTLAKVPYLNDLKYIYENPSRFRNFFFRLRKKVTGYPLDGYCFFYKKEKYPPVSTSKILKIVREEYDFVLVFFWQELLSFQTIDKLYDTLNCKFFFLCADFSPMSGGCHFTNNCQRYRTGCGCCPAFNSKQLNDFTHWNVQYRKKIYDKVKPILLANTYMIESFFKDSYLLKNQRCVVTNGILDLDKFKPLNPIQWYEEFNISQEKKFIVSFGSQSLTDSRKGMHYILEALKIVYEAMTEQEHSQTLIIMAGKNGEQIASQINFDYKDLGFIPSEKLPAFYSVSSLFLCASVNDAGPSMLGQSIACGTPIVAFKMGSALDILKEGNNNGYCANLKDSKDLANGILSILRMPSKEYKKMREDCRKWAVNNYSKESFVKLIQNII